MTRHEAGRDRKKGLLRPFFLFQVDLRQPKLGTASDVHAGPPYVLFVYVLPLKCSSFLLALMGKGG